MDYNFFDGIDLSNDLSHFCFSSLLDIKLSEVLEINKDHYLRLFKEISRKFNPDRFRYESQLINGLKDMLVKYYDLTTSCSEHKCEEYEEFKEHIYQGKRGKRAKRPMEENQESNILKTKRRRRNNM